ncbi:hypothetical protein DQ04_02221110 [Trypanosoma grayi]|uniref:hypothetical protein n=1 Tax=Trypanosoma grayi TaxID=71804 RepID=UPI0004F43F78|nr:hypothetical protein DQ04_02221110 [Trypanosoma grayi]KEG11849.1 hypothetical protein DQ04_02221110 [Trypanosoma grayi]
MFVGRWVFCRGSTVRTLTNSELWQKRGGEEPGTATTRCGCILFLKDDVVKYLRDRNDEAPTQCPEEDLLAALLCWARGGQQACGVPRNSSAFPTTSAGPSAVVERCVLDPCSFGVIAGFVSHRAGGGEVSVLWEWVELANCSTISQLALYVDTPTLAADVGLS